MQQTLPLPLDVKLMNWTASVLFLGCALLALAAGVHWLLSRPVFAIQRIVVQGDLMHNSPATLRPLVQPSLVGNFFTVDLDALRAAFEQVMQREHPDGPAPGRRTRYFRFGVSMLVLAVFTAVAGGYPLPSDGGWRVMFLMFAVALAFIGDEGRIRHHARH